MDACITIYPREFGQYIAADRNGETAKTRAIDWLGRWMAGEITHKDVEINACSIKYDGYSPSGLKTFDEQRLRSSGFSTGNVTSNVQTSNYVRSFHKKECDPHAFDKGVLQASDLKWIKASRVACAQEVASFLATNQSTNDESDPGRCAIAYLVHHYHGPKYDRQRIDHGWIITDNDRNLLQRLDISNSRASQQILDQAAYVFTCQHENSRPLLKLVNNEIVFADPEVLAMAKAYAQENGEKEHSAPRMR